MGALANKTVRIKVPATSANVGSGFDSSGLALALYNEVVMEPAGTVEVVSLDAVRVPTGEKNLIFQAAKTLFSHAREPLTGLAIKQINRIPFGRGLGSSSACIVAGLLGANALLDNRFEKSALIDIAAGIEGHPDNVVPAFIGGFSNSVITESGAVRTAHLPIEDRLDFLVFVPPFQLLTKHARAVLPKQVSYADAVFNLSRSGLLTAAFATKSYDLLIDATADRLHQIYRLPLIRGGERVCSIAKDYGAYAVFISGAGSSLMAIMDVDKRSRFPEIEEEIKKHDETKQYRVLCLKADNEGAVVEEMKSEEG